MEQIKKRNRPMTKEEFFQNITAQGVQPTLQLLAAQNPLGQLQVKRLERLSKDLILGVVSLPNAAIERNRIAMSILNMLENTDALQEDDLAAHSRLSAILRDYLNISENEELASKVLFTAEHEKIMLNRKKYLEELPELDLSPLPKASLTSIENIKGLIASNQLVLALRHTLTLTHGTGSFKNVEQLVERLKEKDNAEKLQIISHENAAIEENRVAKKLLAMLLAFEQISQRKENGFWASIKTGVENIFKQ